MMKYKFLSENHVHTLDGKPLIGTSTALSVLSKELTWWAAGMAVGELGWSNPKITKKDERIARAGQVLHDLRSMPAGDYLALLDRAYRAHDSRKKNAADAGTDLHAALEEWVKAKILGKTPPELPENCAPFVAWTEKNVKKFLASEVHVYSERLWTGGIFDVMWLGNDGKKYLADFKSSKDVYFSHFVQCAGYCIQLSENGGHTADGRRYGNPQMPDAIAVIPFGSTDPTPRIRHDVAAHVEAFESVIKIHKLRGTHGV